MTRATGPIRRFWDRVAGCAAPPAGRTRISTALTYGVLTHLAFVAGVGAMMFAMFFGLGRTLGSVPLPWALLANAGLILQFPLLHSALLSDRGRRVLNRAIPGPHARTLATTTNALIASVQLLVLHAVDAVWHRLVGGGGAFECRLMHGLRNGVAAAVEGDP